MEARVASVLNVIARSMAPSGLRIHQHEGSSGPFKSASCQLVEVLKGGVSRRDPAAGSRARSISRHLRVSPRSGYEQEILEIFENFPLERISERTQIVDGPVPQIAKETPGVVGLVPRERVQQWTVDAPTPREIGLTRTSATEQIKDARQSRGVSDTASDGGRGAMAPLRRKCG